MDGYLWEFPAPQYPNGLASFHAPTLNSCTCKITNFVKFISYVFTTLLYGLELLSEC